MSRRISTLRNALFGAAVAASLAFGARTAAAGSVTPARQVCADPSAEGTCASQSDCRKICNRLSNGLIAICDLGTGCCDCQKL